MLKLPKIRFIYFSGLLFLVASLLAACGEATSTPASAVIIAPTAAVSSTAVASTAANVAATTAPASSAPASAIANTIRPPTATVPATTASSPTVGQARLSLAAATVANPDGQLINMQFELARTSQEQEVGLMGRTSLPDDTGMLFIFPNKVRLGFWMKNTLIPLSIAWIDEKGKVLEIQDMEAQSEQTHTPGQEYIWALEVPKGYFAKKGIKAGSIVKFTAA